MPDGERGGSGCETQGEGREEEREGQSGTQAPADLNLELREVRVGEGGRKDHPASMGKGQHSTPGAPRVTGSGWGRRPGPHGLACMARPQFPSREAALRRASYAQCTRRPRPEAQGPGDGKGLGQVAASLTWSTVSPACLEALRPALPCRLPYPLLSPSCGSL